MRRTAAIGWRVLGVVLLLSAAFYVGSRLPAKRTSWFVDATQPLRVDGATFAFTLEAPGTLELVVEGPEGWTATFGRILPAQRPQRVFVTDTPRTLRAGDTTVDAPQAGAYALWFPPVPTAMGETLASVRLRVRRR